jgi:hypothetical protein
LFDNLSHVSYGQRALDDSNHETCPWCLENIHPDGDGSALNKSSLAGSRMRMINESRITARDMQPYRCDEDLTDMLQAEVTS